MNHFRLSIMLLGLSFTTCSVVTAAPAEPNFATAAPAFPTTTPFWGPSGLGVMPTSATVAPNQLQVGIGWEHITPQLGGQVNFLPAMNATWGFKNGEVGLGALLAGNGNAGSSSKWNGALYVKERFFEDVKSGTSVAVGVHFYKPEGSGSDTALFLTGGTPIIKSAADGSQFRLEGGLVLQNIDLSGESTSQLRPMVGLNETTACQLTLAADYIPSAGTQPQLWSVLARYTFPCKLSAQVGYGQQFQDDKKYFATIAYAFGK